MMSSPIDVQDIAFKNAMLLCGNNKYTLFELYEMLVEDYYYRQSKLINESISNYINDNYVDVKDIDIGDKNVFWVSSNE